MKMVKLNLSQFYQIQITKLTKMYQLKISSLKLMMKKIKIKIVKMIQYIIIPKI